MKKTIFAVCALILYICWMALEPIPRSTPFPPRKTQGANPQVALAKAPELRVLPSGNPGESELREKLAQLDHELARAGYPEVLLDERLSETEREEMISKVLMSTEIYSRIVRLKVAALQRNGL